MSHRTQSSIAVTATGDSWAIINCAPDVLAQIKTCRSLHPRMEGGRRRHSPISSVLLTNGDIDHVAGLLNLRERQSFSLFATAEIHEILHENSIFDVLAADYVDRRQARLDEPFELVEGVMARIFAVPGKVPLYLEGQAAAIQTEGEFTVGVALSADDTSIFYLPGCSGVSAQLADQLAGADVLLFDGTVWRDEEMIEAGVGSKTGRRMGHMPISGDDGSLAALAGVSIGRKIYVHINNTNPILVEDSAERREVEAAGWDVAYDGMEIVL